MDVLLLEVFANVNTALMATNLVAILKGVESNILSITYKF